MRSLAAFFVIALIWTAGLMAFAARVDRASPAQDPAAADGIVALTGGATDQRIAAALQLLEAGRANRLLISGVSRKVTRPQLQTLIGAPKALFDCCIDLGFTAENTVGNARETAEWARAKGYHRLILVTADYHMPRAELELKAAMPEAKVAPYPVPTLAMQSTHWWRTWQGFERMSLEYSKYLAVLTREALIGLGPKSAAAPPAPATATR